VRGNSRTLHRCCNGAMDGTLQWLNRRGGTRQSSPWAQCKVPALHLAVARPPNPPPLLSQWLPTVVAGWTVGASHFNQIEVPDQVNAMIEGFLRHYV
jgi:hypothetical protein